MYIKNVEPGTVKGSHTSDKVVCNQLSTIIQVTELFFNIMQFEHQEINNGYNGYIKRETFVQKSEKRACKMEEHITQELYIQENLPLFL
jgi:hypothetical protein